MSQCSILTQVYKVYQPYSPSFTFFIHPPSPTVPSPKQDLFYILVLLFFFFFLILPQEFIFFHHEAIMAFVYL
jgi:hypothetical protein